MEKLTIEEENRILEQLKTINSKQKEYFSNNYKDSSPLSQIFLKSKELYSKAIELYRLNQTEAAGFMYEYANEVWQKYKTKKHFSSRKFKN